VLISALIQSISQQIFLHIHLYKCTPTTHRQTNVQHDLLVLTITDTHHQVISENLFTSMLHFWSTNIMTYLKLATWII